MHYKMDKSESWTGTSFPNLEKEIIDYWREIHAIEKIIEKTRNYSSVSLIDGPPFCTGLPHYGHYLVSTLKDTMTRYFTMKGYNVDRGFGWDTHGVPMEMLAKKIIGYNTKKELLEFGIDKHNDVCRGLVTTCAAEWYQAFERIGRWVDSKREYKTMDPAFMESVIWAFSELYKQGMIFEGYKVMPYSTGCTTALSHFEAKQNYKTTTDLSAICCFEIVSTEYSNFKHDPEQPTHILAWTTTAFTLPSNMALCTGMNIQMVCVFDYQNKYNIIMSNSKFESTYAKMKFNNANRFRIIERILSYDLVNAEYKPPFDYFYRDQSSLLINKRMFRVVADHYVKENGDESGTGFVHLAPSHGEEDFRVCCQNGIIDSKNSRGNLINVVDDDGCFIADVKAYAGMYVKKADPIIIRDLRSLGLLFDSKPCTHSYPFCYRTDTPLLYKLVSGWFLNASNPEFREKMLANNAKINWIPPNVGTNDFDNWLQGSVDWCISRSRYWGTPIPVWKSADSKEILCIGSVQQLRVLSGIDDILDLHIEHIDRIQIPSAEGRGMLSRVEGVLDCWFESGSVPYAQIHYPFENADMIDPKRPYIADFITESKDQTRGWFYTLTVLATALFNKPAFQNVIVTGIINGTNGEKMSKSKGNYPDPNILLDKYGADTLRLYLLSTPVVKAESIRFDESAISKLQQNSIVKIYNIALLLMEKINLYNKEYTSNPITYPSKKDLESLANILDRWIVNKTGLLLKEINNDLSTYKAHAIAAKVLTYIEQLTNWYVKMARERLKGNSNDWRESLQTLLFVIHSFIRIAAPVMPFITETVYAKIKAYIPTSDSYESIHFAPYPKETEFVFDDTLEDKFDVIENVITLIREVRNTLKFNNRRPVGYVKIGCVNHVHWDIIQDILDYIRSESNVMSVEKLDFDTMVVTKAEPNATEIKSRLLDLGQIKSMKNILEFITNFDSAQINELQRNSFVVDPVTNITIHNTMVNIKYLLKESDLVAKVQVSDLVAKSQVDRMERSDPSTKISPLGIIVKLDTSYSDQVQREHCLRLINTAIQMHRKEQKFKPWHIVHATFQTDSPELNDFIMLHASLFISKNVKSFESTDGNMINATTHEIINNKLRISSKLSD